MTTKSARNTLLLAKLESEYGVDPAPTPAANAMLVANLRVEPIQAEVAQRQTVQPYLGGRQRIHWGIFSRCQFEVEMVGSGDPEVAPAWGPLLRACGAAQTAIATAGGTIGPAVAVGTPEGEWSFTATAPYGGSTPRTVTLVCTTGGGSATAEFTVSAPAAGELPAYEQTGVVMTDATPFALGGDATITPTIAEPFDPGDSWTIDLTPVRMQYSLVSTGQESLTLYYFIDGIRHIMTGWRGEMGINLQPGLPMLTFSGHGLAVPATDTALPSDEDYDAWQVPVATSPQATPIVSLHGHDARLASFSLQLGNQAGPRRLVNHYSVPIRDRDVTGQINLEMVDLAALNPWASATANTLGPFRLQQGAAPGQVVALRSESCQLLQPQYEEMDSVVHLRADLAFVPVSGNDEIVLYTA